MGKSTITIYKSPCSIAMLNYQRIRHSKGCLQIPVRSQWYVPISTVLWEMAIHRFSVTLEVLVEAWTVPRRIPTYWCAFLNCKWFSEVWVTSRFLFLADPGDGYIPRRRALDAEHCKYHGNSLCARLNGMYPSQGFMCFFSPIFFQKKNGWERFDSP